MSANFKLSHYPGVATMDMPRWGLTGRAPSCRLCGSNQEGNQGLRFIDMPGVEVKRCNLGQQMDQRVSNLQGCEGIRIFWTTSLNIHR
jgi:hypothetical protein